MAFPGGAGGGFTSTMGVTSTGLPLLSTTNFLGHSVPAGMSQSQGQGQGQEKTITQLSQETELQKMLADERMRGEMHKTNYQMIKAEHSKLQDENRRLERELEEVRRESHSMEDRLQALVNKSNRELTIKTAELEEFKAQSLTPDKLELIKLKIAEDLEQPFRDRFSQLEQEVEHYRSEFNKLRYEHSFLKSEYEHEQTEHKRVLEEMNMQYETEINNLHKDKEAIIAKHTQENSQDGDKVRTLYRDNAQLNLKVKGLLTELDEIRAQREQVGLQSDHVSRLQARQLSEHVANIKALQSEKESLQLHMEQLEKELSISHDSHRSLTTRIHDLEKQNAELRGRMEETLHRHKMEVTDLKMNATKTKGELERDRDSVLNELEGLKAKQEVLQKALGSQTDALVDKEKEVARKVQAVREEEWERVNRLEEEKLDLEARLQEFERLKIDEESQRYAEREAGEERVREAERQRIQADRELKIIRTQLETQSSLSKDLEQEKTTGVQLKEKCARLKSELQDARAAEQELLMENDKYKASVDMLENELVLVKAGMEKEVELGNQRLTQHKMTWLDEKTQLERRLDELEKRLKQSQRLKEETVHAHAKKKKKYQKVVNRLQDKMQIMEAQNEQLELEKQALKNQIPKETYTRAVRRLRELQHRHTEFRNLLTAANVSQVPIGGLSFMAASMQPVDASSPLAFRSSQHQQDLAVIRSRLDELGENQKLQLDALLGGGIVPHTTRSEMDKENDIRPLTPEGSAVDVSDL